MQNDTYYQGMENGFPIMMFTFWGFVKNEDYNYPFEDWKN